MYAIRNKRTKRWMFGTWYQDGRRIQRTSDSKAMIFENYESAELEFRIRDCGKSYEIVPVRLETIE